MHALPLAADLSAATMLSAPPAAGPTGEGVFAAHLSAAAAQPGQDARTLPADHEPDQAQPGDLAALADDAARADAHDQELAGATSLAGAAAASLITIEPPWTAAASPTGGDSAAVEMGSGSAVGRMLAAIALAGQGQAAGRTPAAAADSAAAPAPFATPLAADGETAPSFSPSAPAAPAASAATALSTGSPATPVAGPAQSTTTAEAGPVNGGHTVSPAARDAVTQPGAVQAATPATAVAPAAAADQNPAPAASNRATTPTPAELGAMVEEIRFGRIVTVPQAATVAGEPLAADAAPAVPVADGQARRQEVDGLAIRANVADDAPAKVTANTDSAQEQSGGEPQRHNDPAETVVARQAEALQAAKIPVTLGPDGQPLPFALQREAAIPAAAGAAGLDPASLRLPSGLIVPDTTVMDQLLARFALQRRLESGSVHLRLNPRELGELHLEIKVEQDNIKAHIIAQNPQAQEMIDRHLPRLREALEQQGLNLQQVEVTLAANDHTDSQRFQEHARRQLEAVAPPHRQRQPALPAVGTGLPAAAMSAGSLNVVA